MLTIDQIAAAPKAQLAAIANLSQQAIKSAEQLADLNLRAGKALLTGSATCAHDLLAASSPQELLSVCASAVQPLINQVTDYGHSLYDIASKAGAELGKVANTQASNIQKQFSVLLDSALKNSPQGSEAAVVAIKNAVSSTSVAIETMQKAIKQASDLTETNFHALADAPPKNKG